MVPEMHGADSNAELLRVFSAHTCRVTGIFIFSKMMEHKIKYICFTAAPSFCMLKKQIAFKTLQELLLQNPPLHLFYGLKEQNLEFC